MIGLDHHALELGVRWLHVASMALMFGGALLLWIVHGTAPSADGALRRLASTYEGAFWAAAGLIVMTGVGNAAAFGRALLPAETGWGVAFLWKLAIVVLLLGISIVRSLAVVQLGSTAPPRTLRRLYGGTTAAIAVAVALAMVMAHGT